MRRRAAVQSERWALLGNAVTVPVAKWLGEQLASPYRHKYCTGARDRSMDHGAGNPNPGISPATDAPTAAPDGAAETGGSAAGADAAGARAPGSGSNHADEPSGVVQQWMWDNEDFADDGVMFEYKVLTHAGAPERRVRPRLSVYMLPDLPDLMPNACHQVTR
jgi:hypothetical protein